jgi:hypothetical protein
MATLEQIEMDVTTDMIRQNSFGITDEESNVELHITIGINSDTYGWFELYEKGSFVRKVKLREISPDKALSLSKQWNLIIARNDIALDLMKSRF